MRITFPGPLPEIRSAFLDIPDGLDPCGDGVTLGHNANDAHPTEPVRGRPAPRRRRRLSGRRVPLARTRPAAAARRGAAKRTAVVGEAGRMGTQALDRAEDRTAVAAG